MVHPLHRRRQIHAENIERDEAEAAKKPVKKKTPKKSDK